MSATATGAGSFVSVAEWKAAVLVVWPEAEFQSARDEFGVAQYWGAHIETAMVGAWWRDSFVWVAEKSFTETGLAVDASKPGETEPIKTGDAG